MINNLLINKQMTLYQQPDSLDLIKCLNKELIFLIFYHEQMESII